jgi:PRTRC genetic system ThiF family protein
MKFLMPLAERAVAVHVIGAGGTGSALLSGLVQLGMALRELGHPGLDVTVWDDDTVSKANIGRQLFAPADIGKPKAAILVNRINLSMGLKWKCEVARFTEVADVTHGVLIGCVDSRHARAQIFSRFRRSRGLIWLDCGNNQYTGQVVFGAREHGVTVVPSVGDLFPETVDAAGDKGDDLPSCSLAEALTKQDLMINRFVADTAVNLLFQLFRKGEVETQGAFIDVARFSMMPIPLDPNYWRAQGFDPDARPAVEEESEEEELAYAD